MNGECITVCVGGAGCQLGQTVWRQYCKEHLVSPTTGKLQSIPPSDAGLYTEFDRKSRAFETIFYLNPKSDAYQARNLSGSLYFRIFATVYVCFFVCVLKSMFAFRYSDEHAEYSWIEYIRPWIDHFGAGIERRLFCQSILLCFCTHTLIHRIKMQILFVYSV